MSQEYVFFWGNESPFSQWHSAKFVAKSVVDPDREEETFYCAEQYMMAEKALLFGDERVYKKIMAARSPKTQKALGREIRGFKEAKWKKWRKRIVFNGNLEKFTQNPQMKQRLMATGNKILVEASPYDRIWGIGMRKNDAGSDDPSRWKGLNLLGYIETEVREEIKKQDAANAANA